MRLLRALTAADGRTRLPAGSPLRATRRWRREIPGFSAHFGLIDGPSGGLFISDGWGVTYASLRFRRYGLATGEEEAVARTGTAIRCATRLAGLDELLAASDNKLFRFGMSDLSELERWDRRIPRYASSIAVRGAQAAVANWMDPRVAIVDLATGRVRRRDAPAMIDIIDGAENPLLVSGTAPGGVASVDLAAAVVGPTRPIPPALGAAVDPDEPALWSIVGIRATWSRTRVTPGEPSRVLRRDWLDDRGPAEEWEIPGSAKTIAVGRQEIWLGGSASLVTIGRPIGAAPPRVWQDGLHHPVRWFDPDARLAVTIDEHWGGSTATIEAFRIE